MTSPEHPADEHVSIRSWQVSGITLHAGNRVVSPEQLLDFARTTMAKHPHAQVELSDFALRVVEYGGDRYAAPRLQFSDEQ